VFNFINKKFLLLFLFSVGDFFSQTKSFIDIDYPSANFNYFLTFLQQVTETMETSVADESQRSEASTSGQLVDSTHSNGDSASVELAQVRKSPVIKK
jgi:hypothetical protein